MSNGCGNINCWGFSPAVQLLDIDGTNTHNVENLLLVGAGDLRHVFAILQHLIEFHNDIEPVHIYIVEARLEIYARMLLMLYLLSREPDEMSLAEKVETYLEIYGNIGVRPATRESIKKIGTELVKMITDESYMSKTLPFVDTSSLKYKEIDALEGIFKFWREEARKPIKLESKHLWDIRLRQYLGTRYDSQRGAFDWDYNMRLAERDPGITKVISPGDYCKWRSNGIAFELREAEYSEPNRTLITPSVLKDHSGDKTIRYGYWGDIVVSPYISVITETVNATTCENEQKATPGERPYTANVAPVIAEKKLMKIFQTISTGTIPRTGSNACTEILEVEGERIQISERISKLVKIHFLPITAMSDLHRKSRFEDIFDVCFISISLFHSLNSELLSNTFRSNSLLVAEMGRYIPELTHEQAEKLDDVVDERLKQFGAKNLTAANVDKKFQSFRYYRYDKPSESEPTETKLTSDNNNTSDKQPLLDNVTGNAQATETN